MKNKVLSSALFVFACLPAFGNNPLNTSGRQQEYGYPQAEYCKAGSILMYTPGTELFDGVIHPDAIDELLEHDCFGHDTVVVVKDRWRDQYQMHLDTYFNVIDRDLCTMCFNRFDAKDSRDINYLTMDMYVRPAGGKAYRLDSTNSGKGFREFLQRRGVKIIRISKEDADHYANNFLTVDARHIMSMVGQGKALEAEYERNGVKVEWVPLDNLIDGYGAAHCMTQVLKRNNFVQLKSENHAGY